MSDNEIAVLLALIVLSTAGIGWAIVALIRRGYDVPAPWDGFRHGRAR